MKFRVTYSIIHNHGVGRLKNREKQKTKVTRGSNQANTGFVNIFVDFSAI